MEAMINPIAAACGDGFIPDDYHILTTPGSQEAVAKAMPLVETIVGEHGGDVDVVQHSLTDELDFETIVSYYATTIEEASTPVAVDVTPGRKFMSAIAFQAGLQYSADHVYYLHLASSDFYGQVYENIPRPSVSLIDFTEVVG